MNQRAVLQNRTALRLTSGSRYATYLASTNLARWSHSPRRTGQNNCRQPANLVDAKHTESTERQYARRQRAVALGWPIEQVVVIDRDLGHSGASAADREGFQQLVRDVGLGRAGLVMGLEVSRLARNSMDWHRLLEICALTETLILDEDGLYDPAHFNDRLLLGLNRPDSYSTSYSTSQGSARSARLRLE
ncbi:MAG TPA: recombinase family protein [Gemmatimonadales bacterium]|nr:recombinase family protein [Gemmatimonadales bacterium]